MTLELFLSKFDENQDIYVYNKNRDFMFRGETNGLMHGYPNTAKRKVLDFNLYHYFKGSDRTTIAIRIE